MARPETRARAIWLRTHERKSLPEIQRETGASKGALSLWLRPYPLTEEERHQRRLRKSSDRTHLRKERGEECFLHQKIDVSSMDRHRKAKIAEAAVLFRLVVFGFNPFGSPFDGDKADWVVEHPTTKKFHRIQVRWCKVSAHGLPTISLKCVEGHNQARRFQPGEFDFLVGYDFFTDTAYVFRESEVVHLKAAVTVRPDAAEAWEKLLEEDSTQV